MIVTQEAENTPSCKHITAGCTYVRHKNKPIDNTECEQQAQ